MHIRLTLLPVTLRRIALDGIGYKAEIRFIITIISKATLQITLLIGIVSQFVLLIGAQQISIDLLSNHLVRNHKLGLATIGSINGQHAKVKEQTDEIVRIVDTLGRKSPFQVSRNKSIRNQMLDDAGIMGKLLVVADEHAKLVII